MCSSDLIKGGRIDLESALEKCADCDAVLIAVGSDDRHDSVVQALSNTSDVCFERVQVQPGSACAFAASMGKPHCAFPVSATLEAFETLVRPVVLRRLGRTDAKRPSVAAEITRPLQLDPGYSHCIKAVTTYDDGKYSCVALGGRPSGARPWSLPNSLILIPPNVDTVRKGEIVEAILLTT